MAGETLGPQPPRLPQTSLPHVEDIRDKARKDALLAVAHELEIRASHISHAIKWVKADRADVAEYLAAVRHGLSLGALAARAKL